MSKRKTIILMFLIIIIAFLCGYSKVENIKTYKEDLKLSSNQIEDNVNDQLDKLDFSKLDNLFESFNKEEKEILKSSSFLSLVKNLIYEQNFSSFQEVFSYLLNLIFNSILQNLPFFVLIFLIAILYGIIDGSQFVKNDGTKKVIFLVCISSISVIIFKIIFSVLESATNSIGLISNILEFLLPIILTLITVIGGVNTASVFQPTLAIFCNVIAKIFSNILLPIFIFLIIFNVVGNLYSSVKLEKFSKFLNSLFKSTIGIVFTVFIAFLSLQGLTSSAIDGISIKTAKYALKSYIPIIGSYLSEGVGLILLSTGLIKNAVGVAGLVVVIFFILKPVIQILILSLIFKLFSAILEVISSDSSKLLYDVSKSLGLLNICLIAIGIMVIIFVSILLSVSNIF